HPLTVFPSFSTYTAPPAIYTLSLHDALPISSLQEVFPHQLQLLDLRQETFFRRRSQEALIVRIDEKQVLNPENFENIRLALSEADRKSTRLNSSHVKISYAVFCLKKKKKEER